MTLVPSGQPNPTADHFLGQPKFDVIRQLAISLLKRNTLNDPCWEISTAIGSLPGFEDSVVYLVDGERLVQTAAYGLKATPQRHIVNPLIIPVGQGIVGTVAATGVAELIFDTAEDPRYIRDEYAGRAEISVPVTYQDRVIAVLDSEHAQPGAYTPQHLEILQAMANVCAPRIASAQVEEANAQVRRELETLNSELEERVQRRTAQLVAARDTSEKQRDRLKTVLNAIQDGLIVLNRDRCIDLISPSAARLLNVSLEDALGTRVERVLQMEGLTNLVDTIDRLKATDQTEDATLVRSDGTTRDIRWHVGAMGADDVVVVISDVTEYKYLARQTQQLDRMQSLGVLAGGIAHDFNNNLAAIDASLACIAAVPESPEHRAIDIASQASAAAAQLTKQLMTYARGGKPVRRPTELQELLDLAVDLATSGSPVTVEADIASGLPAVDVDAGQMTQVFSNIILNAVQALGDGGRIQITATGCAGASEDERGVRITITDNGPGFSRGDLSRVFEPYYSTRDDGHGLGLTTCYFVVDSHGGRIEAANSPSGGGQITIWLPVTTATALPVDDDGPLPAACPMTILLLDDERVVRSGVTMMLELDQHKVIATATGEDALAAARDSERVDVALLDLTVRGGLGGLEIVEALKQQHPAVCCVAMSGYSDRDVMSEPEQFGFDAVLPKPFRRAQICELISQLQDDSRPAQS